MGVPLQVAVLVLSWSLMATAAADQPEIELGEVRVIAAPEHEMILEAETTTMSTISGKEMAERQVKNIKDLVRYEPGVSVTNNPSRFGLAGFNIRGLDENYILMNVDGVRLPDSFKIGGYFNTGRDMVDVGLLTGLDIVRGAGSTVHGVDALGGVAAYRTLRPEDLLAGRSTAVSTEVQYASANQLKSWLVGAAAGNDVVKALAKGVVRRGHEAQTTGEVGGVGNLRTIANPQSVGSNAMLFHLTLTPVAGHRSDLTVETFDRTVDTHDLSQIKTSLDEDLHAHDTYRRRRVSLDHRISDLALGSMNLKLYQQESEVRQYAHTLLKLGPYTDGLGYLESVLTNASGSALDPDRQQERISLFTQDVKGLRLDATSRFVAAGRHTLGWGGEYSQTQTEQLRDGYSQSLTGLRVREVSPMVYPSRDFPLSSTHRASLFAQEEWMLNDAWSLMFGSRYELYRLKATSDALFEKNPYGAQSGDVSMQRLVPKLGAVWRFGEGYSLASNYALGFRPPPYEETNMAFSNPNQGVVYVPNPNLKAETARQFELSLRHTDAVSDWALTVFDNRYLHFLDSSYTNLVGRCPGDPRCQAKPPSYWLAAGTIPVYYPGFYQTINLDRVRIHGFEAKLSRELLQGWRLRSALSYSRGRDLENGAAICRINPPSGVIGLSHERGAWRAEAVLTGALSKKSKDTKQLDGSSGSVYWGCNRQFLPEGYHAVDFFVHWQFDKTGRLSLGINNLLDATYYQWADVPVNDPHIADSSTGKERYSMPGRNFVLSLNYGF